jgi:hypothetical protein
MIPYFDRESIPSVSRQGQRAGRDVHGDFTEKMKKPTGKA